MSRRERDVVAFLERRDQTVAQVCKEARDHRHLHGEVEAVRKALDDLKEPGARPWRRHVQRLEEAAASGKIEQTYKPTAVIRRCQLGRLVLVHSGSSRPASARHGRR